MLKHHADPCRSPRLCQVSNRPEPAAGHPLVADMFAVDGDLSWAVAFVIGAVLWPFVSVYLRETTGSFVAAFLLIPVILLAMAGIIWFYSPEHARKELDQISV